MKDFMDFVRKQGVVGLAVGFIVGVATSGVVNSLVNDLVNPLIGLIVRTENLDSLTFTISDAVFRYGSFISVLINFVVILATVFVLFKVFGLEKLDAEENEEE